MGIFQDRASIPILQTDLIGSPNQYYPARVRGDMPCKRTATVQNVRVDLWDGPTGSYIPPATPIQMQVVSTSASDGVGGTGALTVHIHYLDTNYNTRSMLMTMNGTTPVLTVPTNILRVNNFHVNSVGSSGAAVGTISLQAVGGAVTYGVISATHNRARMPMFTVPAGMVGYIKSWQVSSASAAAAIVEADLRATCHEGLLLPGVFIMQDQAVGQYIIENVQYDPPIVIPAMADVKVTAISAGATDNSTVASNVVGWYEPL